MAKLINKILSALNNDNVLDSTIEDISICKENLVKNLSNPVFDKNIKHLGMFKQDNKLIKGKS